jgi:anthranilate/para-aminobenzoate synthase component I
MAVAWATSIMVGLAVLCEPRRARSDAPYPAGGGWVNDSEPEAEFQETVNKSKAMLKAVALAETFAND